MNVMNLLFYVAK